MTNIPTPPVPPIAQRRQHAASHHGMTRQDPFHWLRADNWQEVMQAPETLPPDIRSYLDAENAYFAASFETPYAELTEALFEEMKGRIKEDDSDVPDADGPWAYNSRTLEGEQYPLIVRTPRQGGAEQVLLNCNIEAAGAYFGFGGAEHSPDHLLLAWAADRQGSEYFTIRIRDLATGIDRDESVADAASGPLWAAGGGGFYYTEYDDNHRPWRVRYHRLGTAQADDAIVFEEADPGFFVGVGETQSRRFISIEASDHLTSEIWLIDQQAGGPPQLVAERLSEREYDVEERGGLLYILTNAEGAEDFKIVTAPIEKSGAENWTDLVPHRPGILILDVIVLANHLARLERVDGLPRIVIRDLRNGREWTVSFDEEAYSLGMSAGYEFDTTSLRFSYSSPTTPQRIYDLDLETGERTLRKEQEVPSGHDPADYVTRRIFASAADGERVPVTLLHHRRTPIDTSAPALLYGYGAYGMSMPAAFSIAALSLADRGFVYAIAHVRGGMEKGYRWYREGRRSKKPNSFTDFIAAAEKLIQDRYTAKGRIVAEGGSAGGLLMGAVANLRPDLWAGILAEVPFVDVLNTMLDDSLPLTPPEWPEWGNPIESAEDFALIESYAPYEQVAAKAYAPMLVLAGLTDPRVTYWEPAKWVAKLRAMKTDSNPLYLKTHMDAGHAGASGRFDRLKETALSYAFALSSVGLA
ncbi:MAG: S9 family peptidase [Devosia sp.]